MKSGFDLSTKAARPLQEMIQICDALHNVAEDIAAEEMDRARTKLQKAAKRFPNEPRIWLSYGDFETKHGRIHLAQDIYRSGVVHCPGHAALETAWSTAGASSPLLPSSPPPSAAGASPSPDLNGVAGISKPKMLSTATRMVANENDGTIGNGKARISSARRTKGASTSTSTSTSTSSTIAMGSRKAAAHASPGTSTAALAFAGSFMTEAESSDLYGGEEMPDLSDSDHAPAPNATVGGNSVEMSALDAYISNTDQELTLLIPGAGKEAVLAVPQHAQAPVHAAKVRTGPIVRKGPSFDDKRPQPGSMEPGASDDNDDDDDIDANVGKPRGSAPSSSAAVQQNHHLASNNIIDFVKVEEDADEDSHRLLQYSSYDLNVGAGFEAMVAANINAGETAAESGRNEWGFLEVGTSGIAIDEEEDASPFGHRIKSEQHEEEYDDSVIVIGPSEPTKLPRPKKSSSIKRRNQNSNSSSKATPTPRGVKRNRGKNGHGTMGGGRVVNGRVLYKEYGTAKTVAAITPESAIVTRPGATKVTKTPGQGVIPSRNFKGFTSGSNTLVSWKRYSKDARKPGTAVKVWWPEDQANYTAKIERHDLETDKW